MLPPHSLMVSAVIDLTREPEFDSPQNPFLNDDDVTDETEILELGHNYNLRSRIGYKLARIKTIINQLELDLAIAFNR